MLYDHLVVEQKQLYLQQSFSRACCKHSSPDTSRVLMVFSFMRNLVDFIDVNNAVPLSLRRNHIWSNSDGCFQHLTHVTRQVSVAVSAIERNVQKRASVSANSVLPLPVGSWIRRMLLLLSLRLQLSYHHYVNACSVIKLQLPALSSRILDRLHSHVKMLTNLTCAALAAIPILSCSNTLISSRIMSLQKKRSVHYLSQM